MKLLDFDTIIFDLDFTIWDGCEKGFWAKLLTFPFRLDGRTIYDTEKRYIKFHEGIETVLFNLNKHKINTGFLSIGGLQEVHHESQPSIICLRMFGIYEYFNYQKTITYKTEQKSKHIIPRGKTLFIDDNESMLIDVKNTHPQITVLNRYDFKNWEDII
jgi:hypothetical protein